MKRKKRKQMHISADYRLKKQKQKKINDYILCSISYTNLLDLTSACLNATGHRCVVELANFQFDIKYRHWKADVSRNLRHATRTVSIETLLPILALWYISTRNTINSLKTKEPNEKTHQARMK